MTLRDAADYITKLPKVEQQVGKWQIAVEHLMLVAGFTGRSASRDPQKEAAN